ncbi:MAG: hypothetical protein FGM14_07200 [Flavobacteriales bacterium]|nr:hypothetical protein [Flavobacteriales bacterium]
MNKNAENMTFEKIEGLWNYFYYNTNRLLNLLSVNIFFKPILKFYKSVGILKGEKLRQAERNFSNVITNQEKGFNTFFSLNYMVLTFAIFLGTISFYIVKLGQITINGELIYFVVGLPIISFYINWFFIRKDDKYLSYYKKFKTEETSMKGIFLTITIHLMNLVIFILSVFLLSENQ